MQVETEIYTNKIREGVEEIRNKEQLPKWQIDFEKYGGRGEYERIKTLYWDISCYYLDRDEKIREQRLFGKTFEEIAEDFNLSRQRVSEICLTTGIMDYFTLITDNDEDSEMLSQFRKDLHVKLDIPKKYDIYR